MSFGIVASSYVAAGGGGGSQFASEVLADSPLLYWRHGESSGTTVLDSSGNGRDGTYVNSPTIPRVSMVRGDSNGSAYLSQSTNDYATLPNAAWMNVSDMTVMCAVVFSTMGLSMFVTRYHDPDNDRSWFLYSQNREFKLYVRGSGGGETTVNSGFTAIPGEVYWIAAYSSATEAGIRVYDKSGLVGSATGVGQSVNSSSRPFMVGRCDGVSAYQHETYIDEVAFFGSVLSPTRLDDLATEFFAPRPWINRTVATSARNGTVNHTLAFTPAANGSLLLIVAASSATIVPVSGGWTEHMQPTGFAELTILTKVASAGESSFSLSQNNSDRPVLYAVYEFKVGSTYHSGVSDANNVWQTLSSLPGTPDTAIFYATVESKPSPALPTQSMDWYFPLLEDVDLDAPYSVTDGVYLGVAYHGNYTYTSSVAPITNVYNAGPTAAQSAVFAITVAP